jgi:hypothetical protein
MKWAARHGIDVQHTQPGTPVRKNRLPLLPSALAACLVLGGATPAAAQAVKLDIKAFAGASSTTFVEMLETGRERETLFGWQIGFGARVRLQKWYIETLLSFTRWAIRFSDEEIRLKGRVNSIELPFIAGVVPYKNPYFKLYLYGGYVNHFNARIFVTGTTPDGESASLRLRPKEIDLAIYQALARFGASFDLAMFNVDFSYSISMNSAGTESFRTGYHQLQLNLGYLF